MVKEEVIERLYKQYVDYPKKDSTCQTDDRLITENRGLRQENHMLRVEQSNHENEVMQIREVMQRQIHDINKLIDDKR